MDPWDKLPSPLCIFFFFYKTHHDRTDGLSYLHVDVCDWTPQPIQEKKRHCDWAMLLGFSGICRLSPQHMQHNVN